MNADRHHKGFTHTQQLAGGIQRETVSFGVEHIDALWKQADEAGTLSPHFKGRDLSEAEYLDTIGRYNIWTMTDGSTWAIVGSQGVMVVKPETSET